MALLRLTIKNITDKWIRFLLTGLAVVLGVGFVVAVFVITDGLRSTFGDLAQDIAGDVDIYVRTSQEFGEEGLFDPAIVNELAGLDGVANVDGGVFSGPPRGTVKVLDTEGEVIDAGGRFFAGLSWGPANGTFLVTDGPYGGGRPPEGPDEFAINALAAAAGDMELGGVYEVSALVGTREMELVGVFNWADPAEDRTIAAALPAVDLDTAVEFFTGGGGISQVAVDLAEGADSQAVEAAIDATLPEGLELITNEDFAEETESDFNSFLDVFSNILLAFAIITLVVSAFIIYNTFAIVVSQRIRELGLLRALGASGRQITLSIIGEAMVVGLVATVVGIVAGIGIAWILRAILDSLGGGFPDGPLPIKGRTIVTALVMGTGVTTISAVVPALKARRVPPMAALRDDVTISGHTVHLHRRIGIALMVAGVAVLLLGIASGESVAVLGVLAAALLYFGGSRIYPFVGRTSVVIVGITLLIVAAVGDLSTSALLSALAVGALLTFVGMNLVSPLFARQLSAVVGTKSLGIVLLVVAVVLGVATIGAGVRFIAALVDGDVGAAIGTAILVALAGAGTGLAASTWRAPWRIDGRLGTGNAGRAPRRTSSTAAALMIGLALVGTVTVLGSSIKKTFNSVLDQTVAADWFICVDDCQGFDGFSTEVAPQLTALPEVDSVIPYRFAEEAFRTVTDGDVHGVLTADYEDLEAHLDADFVAGGSDDAGPEDLLVYEDVATDLGLTVGDTVAVEFNTGERVDLVVAGVYGDARILGEWVISNEAYDRYLPPSNDTFVSALSAEGVGEDDARAAIEAVAGGFPDVEVRTKEEFRDLQAAQVDQALVVVNVFLGLSLIIALVGIANTLALSVFERTREIGLLRAVGATRGQTSRLIRWEGAIIAVFGGILGLILGIVFGVIAVIVIPEEFVDQIDVPVVQLVIYLVVAALAGLFAAYFPARRAARLDVLDAIAME